MSLTKNLAREVGGRNALRGILAPGKALNCHHVQQNGIGNNVLSRHRVATVTQSVSPAALHFLSPEARKRNVVVSALRFALPFFRPFLSLAVRDLRSPSL